MQSMDDIQYVTIYEYECSATHEVKMPAGVGACNCNDCNMQIKRKSCENTHCTHLPRNYSVNILKIYKLFHFMGNYCTKNIYSYLNYYRRKVPYISCRISLTDPTTIFNRSRSVTDP